MSKILVTGGAGFIGSHVVDELIKKGHEVVVADNLVTGKKENINPQVKSYTIDITSPELMTIFELEKPELVFHLAAQVMLRTSLDNPISDAKTNIIGTINVLEACRQFKVKKIIYTSTGGARVGEPEQLPVDEKHPINPLSPYGISKHTAEHYVWMYNQVYELDYLIFCFGNVYGPRDDYHCGRVTSIFTHQMLNGQQPQIFGDGEQTRDFIYVKDLAQFIVNSSDKNPGHKLFHLANGEQISVNKIFAIIKKHTGYTGEAHHIEAVKGEVRDIRLNTGLVQAELGWEPQHSFDEGLRETVEWFKQNNQ